MSIQWYPGHMTKARREIAASIPSNDVIVEVLDARMPAASENPVLAELRGGKPCIKVLSKSDLADPEATKLWLSHFASAGTQRVSQGEVVSLAVSTDRAADTRKRIPELCKQLAPSRNGPSKSVRVLVVGIPNVGKSTLINTLMERVVAKVGDEPAVTRMQQLVTLKSGIMISDNPGILWPKIEDPDASLRLAFGGAIPDRALDYEMVATFGAKVILDRYPDLLVARYKLESVPSSPLEALETIGRRRGCLQKGGVIDMHKAADVLIHDFRSGVLGRISLETPPS